MTRRELAAPGAVFTASLICLLAIMLFTSPVKKIGYAIAFFGVLLIVLNSLGFFVLRNWGAKTNARNRYRIFVTSLFIVITLMFRSAQSLNWVDGLIVALVVFGLLFYGGRRF